MRPIRDIGRRRRPLFWLLLAAGLWASSSWSAEPLSEPSAKAALAFNFARYTDWPESAVSPSPEDLRVCVIGSEELGEAFRSIEGRGVGDRRVRVRLLGKRDDPALCELIFVDISDRGRIARLFASIHGRSVLTIGELPDFIDYGGIIRLYRAGGRMRFAISLRAAERANLRLSPKLLRLATIED